VHLKSSAARAAPFSQNTLQTRQVYIALVTIMGSPQEREAILWGKKKVVKRWTKTGQKVDKSWTKGGQN